MCSVFSPSGLEAGGSCTRSGAWPSVSLHQAGPQWEQRPPCGRCPSSQTPTLGSASACPPPTPAAQSRCPPGADGSACYHIPRQPHCGERPTPCPPRNPSVARTYTLRPVSPWEGVDTAFQDEKDTGRPSAYFHVTGVPRAPAQTRRLTGSLWERGVSWTLVNSCRIATTWRKWILKNASW